ncbi:erv26 super protein [Friedmanniomyces endolithicus]|nr:erv26 super protein [Friedmanniomyces endolithicus]
MYINLKAQEFDFHMQDLAYRYPALIFGSSRLGKPLVRERHRQRAYAMRATTILQHNDYNGYLGLLLGFLFLTLAIASGLYYLSELVEEHTVAAKKTLTRMIYAVIALQVLLAVVDRLPLALSALSIGSHVVYMQNLRRFPIVKLTDPIFILSCILVIANHWLWFRHFSLPPPSHERYNFYAQQNAPTFTEIASFFGLNVWLVPFALFVSLSAGENVLPSMGSEYATGQGSSFIRAGQEPATAGMDGSLGRTRHKRSNTQSGMAKAAVNGVREWVGPGR